MMRVVSAAVVLLAAGSGIALDSGSRAWQQRLQMEIPLPIPLVEVDAVDPFAAALDSAPVLSTSTPPRKVAVSGRALTAAYVDAEGRCRGAVPLEMPFPALTTSLVSEFVSTRFDPARTGGRAERSWVVVDVTLDGRVKEGEVVDQQLALPDPAVPPVPTAPTRMVPPGGLVNLPATPPGSLTALASPRNLRVRVPARDLEVPLRALVRVTADGVCDRYIPLEMESGLDAWFAAYLSTWRLQPARRDGEAVDCWVVYTARARLKMSSLQSSAVKVAHGHSYDPRSEP